MARDKGLALYEHVEALAVVDTWFEEAMPDIEKAEGEVPEALAALLDMASGDFNEKAERVALKINSYIAESAAIQAEADRLARRAKSRKARADYLKRYLHFCLTKANVPKVNGLLVNVRLQRNPLSVRCAMTEADFFTMLHSGGERFIVTVPEQHALDKKAVLAAYAAGEDLPAGIAVEQGTHLRID